MNFISQNEITNNTAHSDSVGGLGSGGGGIYCRANDTITYNKIYDNTSLKSGGGIYCGGDIVDCYNPILLNNEIVNNTALGSNVYQGGGGIFCDHSNATIFSCTIANNNAVNGGAIYCNNIANPILKNTILWGNTATSNGVEVNLYDEPSDPSFSYCDVEGSSAAFYTNGNFYLGNYQNNINNNPLFLSPTAGSGVSFNAALANWKLQSTSLCIDAGDPNGTYPTTDLDDSTRVINCLIDIGAYEYQNGFGTVTISTNGSTNFCTGDSVTLTASAGASYSWVNGFTTQSITVYTSGNYSVTVSNGNGCSATSAVTTVMELPLPNVYFTGLADTLCVTSGIQSLTGFPSGGTFSGIGVSGNIFNPAVSGVGNFVVVYSYSDSLGCTNGSGVSVYVDLCAGVDEISTANLIKIFPNPTRNQFIISAAQMAAYAKVEIYDMLGEKIYSEPLSKKEILINAPSGVYFVKVSDGQKEYVQKLVIE